MQTFDPKAGQPEGESKKIADDLGLMRGTMPTILESYGLLLSHTLRSIASIKIPT